MFGWPLCRRHSKKAVTEMIALRLANAPRMVESSATLSDRALIGRSARAQLGGHLMVP
jgi:hypothetical protein